jgi:uncharacterized membrane protein YcaP (DUF421 family)
MWFDGWFGLLRVAVVAPVAYFGLVLLLRVSGKRTLAKLNAFDLVITVALGSSLATVVLSKDVALFEGLAAYIALVALQALVSWSSLRWRRFRHLIQAEPSLLLHRGRFLDSALRAERVATDEVLAAIRGADILDVADVEAAILETDGSISIVRRSGAAARSGTSR